MSWARTYPGGFSHPWASLYKDGKVANMRAFVGATPGEWGQGGGEWEGGGGSPSSPDPVLEAPTTAQVSQLQQNVLALKNQVDGVVAYLDPSTDAASKAAVLTLQSNVNGLAAAVGSLVGGTQNALVNYPVLYIKYQGYKAEFDSYGLEVVSSEPVATPTSSKPVGPKPTVPVKPAATPDAPVIVTNPAAPVADNTLPWSLLGGALVLGLTALYFVRKAM